MRSMEKEPNRFQSLAGLFYLLCVLLGVWTLIVNPNGPQTAVKKYSADTKNQSKIARQLFGLDLNKDAIGVVRLDGVISMEKRGGLFFGDSMVERINRNLEKMAKKNAVKAIILKINSPGGTVASCQEIVAQIRDLRQTYKKPIIAMLGDVAASGGYYIASACDLVVASSGTITGSIGVIFQAGQFEGLLRRLGISFATVKSGKFKDIGNPTRAMTLEERQLLQELINSAYNQFLQDVALGRHVTPEEVRPIADGRIFIGEEALRLHLIDSTGGFKEAQSLATKLGNIKGEPRLIWDGDLKEDFLSEFMPAKSTISILPKEMLPSGLLYIWTGY